MLVNGPNSEPMSDINVTPFVDVMLVLLIIFMVAAPMLVQGIDVNLPQATAKAMDTKNERLVVTLTADKKIYLDTVEVDVEGLTHKIKAVLDQKEDQQVYLRADGEVPYGFVIEIMADLKEAGVDRLGMVTEPLTAERKKRGEEKGKNRP